jgi:hypothetical protein
METRFEFCFKEGERLVKNFSWLLIFFSLSAFSQNKTVVIGTMTNRPNAVLVLNPPDGNQGFLVPQLTSAQRQSFKPQSPSEDGLMVFDTTENAFYFWTNGGWVKGLGNESASILAYDAATYKLKFNSTELDLGNLKEIPSVAGKGGNILSTDGTNLLWSPPSTTGDVTAVIAGPALSGGAAQGDATLGVRTDNVSISINGTNALQVTDGGITPAKVKPGSNNTILSTDATGKVVWNTPAMATDAQDLTLAGKVLSLSNDATPVDLSTLTWSGVNITDGSVATTDLGNASVTPAKIAAGAANTILSTNGVGTVAWTPAPVVSDAQDLTLAGNTLSLTNDATPVNLGTLSLNSGNIVDGSIAGVDLANTTIGTGKIIPGANNTILTTNGTGTVVWGAPPVNTDAQDLSLAGNVLSLTNDGTPVDLNALVMTGTNITDGTIAAVDLAAAAVTPAKVAAGALNTVLTTNGTGNVVWTTPAVSPDAQDLSLAGNILSLTNDGTSVNLNSLVMTGSNITDGSITSVDLDAAAVTPAKVAAGALNTVLTTNGTGNVVWTTPAVSPDAQDLTLAANILTLTNDATPINLNALSANGQVTGPLNTLVIANNSITGAQLQNGVVDINKLVTAGVTDAGKVYTTSTTGTPQLELKGALLTGVAVAGDLSGTLPTPTVAKIQGNNVAPGALGVPDAGKVLVWTGTQWLPAIVNGVSPVSQFTMLDPADFTNLREDDTKDKDNIIIFEDNSTYVTTIKKNEGAAIIAPLHLPHGATLEEITLYYRDTDSRNVDFNVYRKTPAGSNQNVTNSWSSTGNLAAVRSSVHTPIAGTQVIDNDTYSYRIVIRLDQTNDVVNSGDADLRVYAVKVKYLP